MVSAAMDNRPVRSFTLHAVIPKIMSKNEKKVRT